MSIVDIINRHAEDRPEAVALRFLGASEGDSEALSFAVLAERTRAFADRLTGEGLSGERVVVACKPGLDYVVAVLGCFAAGSTAVPSVPPRPRTRDSFAAIVADCAAAAMIVEDDALAADGFHASEPGAGPRLFRAGAPTARHPAASRHNDLAYLQYTSGSTSQPKGVRISHDNLIANVSMIAEVYALNRDDGSVSWLPLYHDMGLVAGIMTPLFVGAEATFMAPMSFVQDPLRWIRAIARFRGRMAGGPNFSFGLCLQAFDAERLTGVDLSCWTLALNGAESVSLDTMSAFADRFAEFGFARTAFKPSYGLAEGTLLVSTVAHDAEATGSAGPDGKVRAVVGHPVPPCSVRLRAHDGAILDRPGEIGEVCVSGPSVTSGYWGKSPEALPSVRASGETWVRTGDLAYFDPAGLVICGRLKETIIVQGRNVYPADVEHAALAGSGEGLVRAAAAIGLQAPDGEEVALIVELERKADPESHPALIAELVRAVRESLDLELARVALVRPAALPRTTSGKIQRLACREALQNGLLPIVSHYERPPTDWQGDSRESFEAGVEAILGRRLDADDWSKRLVDLGFDSIGFGRLSAALARASGRGLAHGLLHGNASLRDVSDALQGFGNDASGSQSTERWALNRNQLALLLMQSRFPDSSRFTVARALRVVERMEDYTADGLRAALVSVPAARARVATGDGESTFVLADPDVTERRFASAQQAREWISARCASPWDLERDTLVQVELLRSPDQLLLLCRAHHLVCDIHSLRLLMDVLLAAGSGAEARSATGAPGQLVARETRWDTEAGAHLAASALARVMAAPFEFLNLRRLPFLPADVRTGRVTFELRAEVSQRLSALFRADGATDFVGLAALFMSALAQTVAATEVLVATAVDTRETEDDQATVDNYANLTILRATIRRGETFRELLARVRAYAAQAADLRTLPFSDLVGHVNPPRTGDALPLAEILFLTHQAGSEGAADLLLGRDGAAFAAGQVVAEPVECRVGDPAFDLRVDVVATPGGFRGQLEYRAGVVSDTLVADIARTFETLAERICAAPEAELEWSPRPTPELSGDARSNVGPGLVPSILEVAARRGASTAVVDTSGSHSYAELAGRSAAVAVAIASRGLPAGSGVAVCLPRQFDLVAALLGVWRAGCCFLPIPLNTPPERKRRLLELGSADLLIDESFMAHLAPAMDAPQVVPSPIAFRLFTSGTTGVPKCVEVTTAGLENLLAAMQRLVPLSDTDRIAASSSISFDVAQMELWAPLRVGGRIVLIDTEELLDGRELQKLLDTHAATVMQATPSGYSNLIASGWRGGAGLRLLCAGERLDWDLANELLSRCAGLWNLYGPTETTIYATGCRIDRSLVGIHPNGAPIGAPMDNTSVLILGPDLEPVPQGTIGELCIAGAGLAAGYFGDSALTDARFVTLAGPVAKRIYRSGDRVRLTPEGLLEYLGRSDRQVKVRGQRLDLAEVETLLRELPSVLAAHAMAFPRNDGTIEVRAALVPASDARPGDHEIRRSLREFAPSYAIPSHLRWISELPVNTNGKVELEVVRALLEAPSASRSSGAEAADGLERAILQIWSDVLDQPVVDRDISFFDAGGTSLQLFKVRKLLLDRTGIDVSVIELLQVGGARDFARALGSRPPPVPASRLPDREQVARRRRASLAGKISG